MYKIESEWDKSVEPKQFTEGGKYHYYVRIYLEASAEELDNVQLVKYTLHESFVDPIRVSENRSANFEIKIWTYGYFDINALLFKSDGTTEGVPGYVRWEIPAEPGPPTPQPAPAQTAAAPTPQPAPAEAAPQPAPAETAAQQALAETAAPTPQPAPAETAAESAGVAPTVEESSDAPTPTPVGFGENSN